MNRFAKVALLTRVLLAHIALVTASVCLLTAVFLMIARASLRQQLQLRASTTADLAAAESELAMLMDDDTALKHVAQTLLTNNDVVFVVLTRASGNRPAIALQNVRAGVSVEPRTIERMPDGGTLKGIFELRRTVQAHTAMPLPGFPGKPGASPVLGTVRMGFSTRGQRTLFEYTMQPAFEIAAVALLLIFVVNYALLRRLLRPLRKLNESVRLAADGNFAHRAEIDSEDEVAQVAGAFNRIVEKLGATVASKSYVDGIIRSLGQALIVIDGSRCIQTVNDATCSLLGYTEQELIGRDADEILEGDGRERVYRSKSGQRIPVHFSETPLQESGGARVWLAEDITETKKAEEQLMRAKNDAEEASRAKTMFLANMSHELRTPLNAIIGYSELLEEITAEKNLPDIHQDLRRIESAGKHLLGIVNDVLDTARLEAGEAVVRPSTFELFDVINDVVNTVVPFALQNDDEIEVIRGEHAVVLYTDETKFRQSLLNLVSNACKFTQRGTITIDVAHGAADQDPWVKVNVRDTGIGIAHGDMDKLFHSFSQIDDSHCRKHGGTGLGLAISKRFCQMMGGDISVTSTHGKGSVFTITLPARLTGR